jgi:hypothetical protein
MSVPITPFLRKDWGKADTKKHPLPGINVSLNDYSSISGKREKYRMNPSSDDTIESDLVLLSEKIIKPFIFVSHAPPYGTDLDVFTSGEHVGSRAIRDFITRWANDDRLLASFHGHVHESPEASNSICTMIEGIHCFNPGQNERQKAVLKYVFFEIEGADVSIAPKQKRRHIKSCFLRWPSRRCFPTMRRSILISGNGLENILHPKGRDYATHTEIVDPCICISRAYPRNGACDQ